MSKRIIALFGGSGGLGTKLLPFLIHKYDVVSINSKDIDITDEVAINTLFSKCDFPIIVVLSGYNFDGFIHKQPSGEINKQIEVNIKGFLNILRHCIPQMRANRFGRIVYTSSVLSIKTVIGTSIYSASKSFNDTLVRACALENAKYGITCNSIQLGYFDGGLTYRIPKEHLESILDTIPLKRLGRIEELYNCIEFLINTEYVTGANLRVTGGIDCC